MLVKKFEEQVRKDPGNIAIKTGNESITYDDLNLAANRLAHKIGISQTAPGEQDRVGLLLDHGASMIIAILSTLKAGKVYVPLSPDYPMKRLSFMLSDSGVSLILTDNHNLVLADDLARTMGITVLNIDEMDDSALRENPGIEKSVDSLAYIMYTSGSTGNPKGVKQTHGNVDYFVQNWIRLFSISNNDRMTLFSSFCHDGSVQDMFAALHSGATLYPLYLRSRESSFQLSDFLISEKITIWHSVPSLFSFFTGTLEEDKNFGDLRYILLGGEEVREYEVQMFNRYFPNSSLANVYGQTESSVNSVHIYTPGQAYQKPLIGQFLDETEIVLVDEEGEEVDALGKGEIVVVCPYISPGYWNNEELTRKVFTKDPELGSMYWTGDLGRLMLDGNIEFLGRKDNQVKIRGLRIELGEIESRLLEHESIREAAVTVYHDDKLKNDQGREDQYLCAYFTAENPLESGDLREFLIKEIPDYMIPGFFMQLEAMPLTQSNKIDRKALPKPRAASVTDYKAPENEVEERLLVIWEDVLGVEMERMGVTGNFFDFGGHSLKAVSLAARIHQDFEVRIPLSEIFNGPSVRKMADFIKNSEKESFSSIKKAGEKDFYQLSFNQKRLWVLYQLDPGNVTYNINFRISLGKDTKEELIQQTLSFLMERHESLRTGFLETDHPSQFIVNNTSLPYRFIDISSLEGEAKNESRLSLSREETLKPFDLTKPPLFRALLVKVDDSLFDFIFTIHHIVSDGWTMNLLKREFANIYQSLLAGNGVNLPVLDLQYKDFAEWQYHQLNGDGNFRENALAYWQDKIEEGFPLLELPFNSSSQTNNSAGAGYRFILDKEIKEGLNALCRQNRSTLFMVLFSAYNVILSLLGEQEEVVCAIINAGREHPCLQNMAGYFVNSLVVKQVIDPEEEFLALLERVNRNVLQAFQYQSFPIEMALDELNMPYPKVSAGFNLFNMQEETLNIDLEDQEPDHIESISNVKFDIIVFATEFKNSIDIFFNYKKSSFTHETIEMIADGYKRFIQETVLGLGA